MMKSKYLADGIEGMLAQNSSKSPTLKLTKQSKDESDKYLTLSKTYSLHLNIALTEKLRDKGDKENKTLSRILGEAMAQYLGEDYTKYDYKSARSARKKK